MLESVYTRQPGRWRTRLLAYGLLTFASILILFGPLLADRGLVALGCNGRSGSCGRAADAMLAWLAPWLLARPPLETSFVLLSQCWPLLVIWTGLIAWSLRADRAGRVVRAPIPDSILPASSGRTPAGESKDPAVWIQAREREQQAELQLRSRTQSQQLIAESVVAFSLVVACWVALGALILFCLAFGTPLLGGLSAEALLGTLGCTEPARSSASAAGGACGFWLERLAPYRQPFVGALLSPVWLFTQFFDLLLLWLSLILILAALPILRLGSLLLKWAELRLAVRTVFVLFVMSILGLGYFVFFAEPSFRAAHPADPVPGVGLIMGLGSTLFALPVLALVVITIALLAALATWLVKNPHRPAKQ